MKQIAILCIIFLLLTSCLGGGDSDFDPEMYTAEPYPGTTPQVATETFPGSTPSNVTTSGGSININIRESIPIEVSQTFPLLQDALDNKVRADMNTQFIFSANSIRVVINEKGAPFRYHADLQISGDWVRELQPDGTTLLLNVLSQETLQLDFQARLTANKEVRSITIDDRTYYKSTDDIPKVAKQSSLRYLEDHIYEVQSGDNLNLIAKKSGTTLDAIRNLPENRNAPWKRRALQPGDLVHIPND